MLSTYLRYYPVSVVWKWTQIGVLLDKVNNFTKGFSNKFQYDTVGVSHCKIYMLGFVWIWNYD